MMVKRTYNRWDKLISKEVVKPPEAIFIAGLFIPVDGIKPISITLYYNDNNGDLDKYRVDYREEKL